MQIFELPKNSIVGLGFMPSTPSKEEPVSWGLGYDCSEAFGVVGCMLGRIHPKSVHGDESLLAGLGLSDG